jgi:hypothetical protein
MRSHDAPMGRQDWTARCTPRRARISLNWLVMMSMTRSKRILRAKASPASASCWISGRGSPEASRLVIRLLQLYAAKVRSPITLAVLKARLTNGRPSAA